MEYIRRNTIIYFHRCWVENFSNKLGSCDCWNNHLLTQLHLKRLIIIILGCFCDSGSRKARWRKAESDISASAPPPLSQIWARSCIFLYSKLEVMALEGALQAKTSSWRLWVLPRTQTGTLGNFNLSKWRPIVELNGDQSPEMGTKVQCGSSARILKFISGRHTFR